MSTFTLPWPPAMQIALAKAYASLGNVHKAATEVGVSHSVAHRCLTRMGLMRHVNVLTAQEREAVVAYYRDTPAAEFNSRKFAAYIGRSEISVSRAARAAGLTRMGRSKPTEVVEAMAARQVEHLAAHGHPRGFMGRSHTPGARAVIAAKSALSWERQRLTGTGNMSEASLQRLSDRMSKLMSERPAETNYSRVAHGRRHDLGEIYFRSSWEANYARYLNWLMARGEIDGWAYEPETFWFEKIRRGVRSYKPDFRIEEKGRSYFVEVKGWMDDKSKTKLKRMAKYHPAVEVRVVGQKQYAALARSVASLIPNWETRATAASVRGEKAA